MTNAVRILGLRGNETADEVKARYRALAKKLHPDIAHSDGTEFKAVSEAYDFLKSNNIVLSGKSLTHKTLFVLGL